MNEKNRQELPVWVNVIITLLVCAGLALIVMAPIIPDMVAGVTYVPNGNGQILAATLARMQREREQQRFRQMVGEVNAAFSGMERGAPVAKGGSIK